jgi:Big-like domain-containing protein
MSISITKEIKLYLVSFCFICFLTSCDTIPAPITVQVNYEDGKAVSVDFSYDKDAKILEFFIENELETAILGGLVHLRPKVYSFIPLVPFTENQTYVIREGRRTIGGFKVSGDILKAAPEILAIYPSTDTVPENLLKVYFQFSEPMQEVGHVLDFIKVIDETEGVEKKIFLEMESELWNRKHDLLTLWLDPGRIKTDLIPNKKLGLPILNGHIYTMHIDSNWRSAKGRPLKRSFNKSLVVTQRDHNKPTIKDWKLNIPNANSRKALTLLFSESMDAVLSAETLSIYDSSQNLVSGSFKILEGEKEMLFTPKSKWKTGAYKIHIKSILEDLAGNNLNRLFDENLLIKSGKSTTTKVHILTFYID